MNGDTDGDNDSQSFFFNLITVASNSNLLWCSFTTFFDWFKMFLRLLISQSYAKPELIVTRYVLLPRQVRVFDTSPYRFTLLFLSVPVANHIMCFLSDNKLLCDNQHGLRPLRSCVTELLQLVHEWLSILEVRGSVDAIFLDVAKVFDKLSHPHLLLKLQHHGIKGQLLEWISDFLTTRRQRVVMAILPAGLR